MHDLSSNEIRCLEFPELFGRQIVIAFPAFNLSIVSAGESACESIAGKLNPHSQVMSQWEIHTEVFRTRRFSRIYRRSTDEAPIYSRKHLLAFAKTRNVSLQPVR